ncbi:MAG: LuxR C-terminal-related transcriptional regulator [Planctomycetaceae bacterium]
MPLTTHSIQPPQPIALTRSLNSMAPSKPTSPVTIYAVGLTTDAARALLEATSLAGFGFRQYPTLNGLLEGAAPSATGCVVLGSSNDTAQDELTIGQLTHHFTSIPVVALLDSTSAQHAVALMRLGVFNVIVTPVSHEELVSELTDAVNHSLQSQTSVDAFRDASLRMQNATRKELDVLELIMSGMRNKEIAAKLGITTRAVEDRRFRLMKKVEADSVAELVSVAVRAKYFDQGFAAAGNRSRPVLPSSSRQCVKGIEVWVPDSDDNGLSLEQSCYRDAYAFRDATHGMKFHKGEGLPGRVWQQRAPAFLKDLITTEFVRSDVADADGVTTAVGFPVFDRTEVVAVVLLLLDSRQQMRAAFEHWEYEKKQKGLRLSAGTYINCEKLRRISEFLVLPIGEGMAGTTADRSRPYITSQLNEDANVVRGVALAAENLVSGIGIPLTDSGKPADDVFTLFNSQSSPVFSLMQLWKPTPGNIDLVLSAEYADGVATLSSQLSEASDTDDKGIAGQAWQTRRPVVVGNGSVAESVVRCHTRTQLSLAVALPTIVSGEVTAVTILAN